MAYDTPRFNYPLFCTATTTQTYTASTQVKTEAQTETLQLASPHQVVEANVHTITAGQATGFVLQFLNGTSTIGTCSVVNTAGSNALLTVTTPDIYGTNVNFIWTGTGTASAAETNPLVLVTLGLQSQFV